MQIKSVVSSFTPTLSKEARNLLLPPLLGFLPHEWLLRIRELPNVCLASDRQQSAQAVWKLQISVAALKDFPQIVIK